MAHIHVANTRGSELRHRAHASIRRRCPSLSHRTHSPCAFAPTWGLHSRRASAPPSHRDGAEVLLGALEPALLHPQAKLDAPLGVHRLDDRGRRHAVTHAHVEQALADDDRIEAHVTHLPDATHVASLEVGHRHHVVRQLAQELLGLRGAHVSDTHHLRPRAERHVNLLLRAHPHDRLQPEPVSLRDERREAVGADERNGQQRHLGARGGRGGELDRVDDVIAQQHGHRAREVATHRLLLRGRRSERVGLEGVALGHDDRDCCAAADAELAREVGGVVEVVPTHADHVDPHALAD
mmetsp:Transcript_39362/g.103238  ORF Transcript_39362/g.103238 Transcript_39362/m.103238 type:complete len:295 (-) Transcript_39362:388-1272(-)